MNIPENYAILLVEDDLDDEILTMRALRKHRLANNIFVARDGVEALEYLFPLEKPLAKLPDLVLLDLHMPRLNGLDVLAEIRAHAYTRRLPVVVLTSSVEEQDVVRSYDLGANSYIAKPVDFEQFMDAVHQLGLYWAVLNIQPSTRP